MTCPGDVSCISIDHIWNMIIIFIPIILIAFTILCFHLNRNYSERAEDYFNRNYLDYSDRLDNILTQVTPETITD